jgi:hypothetical protein
MYQSAHQMAGSDNQTVAIDSKALSASAVVLERTRVTTGSRHAVTATMPISLDIVIWERRMTEPMENVVDMVHPARGVTRAGRCKSQ